MSLGESLFVLGAEAARLEALTEARQERDDAKGDLLHLSRDFNLLVEALEREIEMLRSNVAEQAYRSTADRLTQLLPDRETEGPQVPGGDE
jgi:hypothetical protein